MSTTEKPNSLAINIVIVLNDCGIEDVKKFSYFGSIITKMEGQTWLYRHS
jgi:hypothetical protein